MSNSSSSINSRLRCEVVCDNQEDGAVQKGQNACSRSKDTVTLACINEKCLFPSSYGGYACEYPKYTCIEHSDNTFLSRLAVHGYPMELNQFYFVYRNISDNDYALAKSIKAFSINHLFDGNMEWFALLIKQIPNIECLSVGTLLMSECIVDYIRSIKSLKKLSIDTPYYSNGINIENEDDIYEGIILPVVSKEAREVADKLIQNIEVSAL